MQQAQGNAAEALQSYRAGLAIFEQLAQSDPGNAGWQRDLAVSYEKIGDIELAQGDFAAALNSYQQDLAISDRLAKSDPGNAGWQHDLALPYQKIGDVQMAQGDLAAALRSYRESLERMQRLVSLDRSNKQWREDLDLVVARIGGEAFAFVLASDFATALEAADQAIALAPDEIWFRINRATHSCSLAGLKRPERSI